MAFEGNILGKLKARELMRGKLLELFS